MIERIDLSNLSERVRLVMAREYLLFCEPLWMEVYPHKGQGVTAEMIAMEFCEPGLQGYFDRLFAADRTVWIARDQDGNIQGGVSVQAGDDEVQMQGLYVSGHGQGLGSQLFNKVVEYADGRSVLFEVPWYFEAVRFYARKGCVPTGKLVDYPWIDPGMRLRVLGMEMRYQA